MWILIHNKTTKKAAFRFGKWQEILDTCKFIYYIYVLLVSFIGLLIIFSQSLTAHRLQPPTLSNTNFSFLLISYIFFSCYSNSPFPLSHIWSARILTTFQSCHRHGICTYANFFMVARKITQCPLKTNNEVDFFKTVQHWLS